MKKNKLIKKLNITKISIATLSNTEFAKINGGNRKMAIRAMSDMDTSPLCQE